MPFGVCGEFGGHSIGAPLIHQMSDPRNRTPHMSNGEWCHLFGRYHCPVGQHHEFVVLHAVVSDQYRHDWTVSFGGGGDPVMHYPTPNINFRWCMFQFVHSKWVLCTPHNHTVHLGPATQWKTVSSVKIHPSENVCSHTQMLWICYTVHKLAPEVHVATANGVETISVYVRFKDITRGTSPAQHSQHLYLWMASQLTSGVSMCLFLQTAYTNERSEMMRHISCCKAASIYA